MGKPLAYANGYTIKVGSKEVQSDDEFTCNSCKALNPSMVPTDEGTCTYHRDCVNCGKQYHIQSPSHKFLANTAWAGVRKTDK